MIYWMDKIAPALKAEGLLENPRTPLLIPAQFYGQSLSVFQADFIRFLQEKKWAMREMSIFVDGVVKKTSAGGEGDLDTAFRELLQGMQAAWEWVDLSQALHIPPQALHASHVYVDRIRPLLRERSNHVLVVLGSGSLTDLVKHALHLEGLDAPLIIVPTALTVTAFTSSFAVLDFHGAKRTLESRPASATFWVAPFLESAPDRMSRAGYGDLLARFVAYGDWFLGHRLGVMDRYDECAYRLMEPFVPGIKSGAASFSIHPLPTETTACIAAALAMAGIAMSVTGETTPLSGLEHVISHALDFRHLLAGRELALHGEQVALGSVINTRAIDWLLDQDLSGIRTWRQDSTGRCLSMIDDLLVMAAEGHIIPPQGEIKEKLASARREFHAEYRKKSERWASAREQLPVFIKAWPEIRKELMRLTIRTGEMVYFVKQAGLPTRPEETLPPTTEGELRWAVRFAPFVRSRINTADLLFWMGKDPSFILEAGFA
jgi:glycerol-1-phosphate dehydrogenase [NAD(P)+]